MATAKPALHRISACKQEAGYIWKIIPILPNNAFISEQKLQFKTVHCLAAASGAVPHWSPHQMNWHCSSVAVSSLFKMCSLLQEQTGILVWMDRKGQKSIRNLWTLEWFLESPVFESNNIIYSQRFVFTCSNWVLTILYHQQDWPCLPDTNHFSPLEIVIVICLKSERSMKLVDFWFETMISCCLTSETWA